jgi:hypothetical protein
MTSTSTSEYERVRARTHKAGSHQPTWCLKALDSGQELHRCRHSETGSSPDLIQVQGKWRTRRVTARHPRFSSSHVAGAVGAVGAVGEVGNTTVQCGGVVDRDGDLSAWIRCRNFKQGDQTATQVLKLELMVKWVIGTSYTHVHDLKR